MRALLIVIFAACIQSCEQKSHANKDDLAATWSADGKTMIITRKGVQIATFSDSTDACHVQLYGPDGLADAAVSYYEEPATVGASESKNVILSWSQPDGAIKTIAYDNKGNIVAPDATSKSK